MKRGQLKKTIEEPLTALLEAVALYRDVIEENYPDDVKALLGEYDPVEDAAEDLRVAVGISKPKKGVPLRRDLLSVFYSARRFFDMTRTPEGPSRYATSHSDLWRDLDRASGAIARKTS